MAVYLEEIRRAVQGKHPLIYLQSPEEDRVLNALKELSQEIFGNASLNEWSCTQGLTDHPAGKHPVEALEFIQSEAKSGFYVMKDLFAFMDDAATVRALRETYYDFRAAGDCFLIIISPELVIPKSLEKEMCLITVELPTLQELHEEFEAVQKEYDLSIDEKIVSEITLGLKGLTLNEAGHVLHRVFASGQSDEASILEEIFNEKKMLVKKTGDLEFVPPQLGLDAIGGMENIKEWVLNREGVFSQESVESGLPIPKGILVMGISGCGKSLLCKAVASLWKMPLFRLDMNLVFSGLHGSPEASFHNALRTIESVAPAVLWIDEIENGLGMNKEGEFDQSHIFSSFLTWMQEKPPLIFVAATANHIESLPAEIIRKGRFDQVFFCDLPYEQEREAIFKIHLEKNGGKVEDFDMERLVVGTEGWNGAEIEQAVISARIDASREDRDFNTRDIHRHLRSMVPLSETMSEQIKGIRNWAWGRATTASKKPQKKKT